MIIIPNHVLFYVNIINGISGDHGPWNSWDRVPYITKIGNGSSSIIPAFQQIHNNFIMGTYQTQEGIDTDDGSSYYNTHDNFFVYGDFGLKNVMLKYILDNTIPMI